ncbi:MAG: serine acetyltransferase [Planctomycetaceae bacterium]|jgi:serine O-acetyltransferase|nr:serine acetyltransferase [Planctomycetaceae bacterium]
MLYYFEQKLLLPELTEQIIATYRETGTTHHLDLCPMPNYNNVAGIIEDLKEILFPGYRGRDRLHSSNIMYYIGDLLGQLHDKLCTVFEQALCHGGGSSCSCSPEKRQSIEQIASGKTVDFLMKIPDIRRMLNKDVAAAYSGDPACKSQDEVIFCYPGLEAITVYRLAHAVYELGIPLLPRMMTEWAHSKTGIDIHPGATIGEYFFIDHGTGVVIGATCVIGNWVKLYQGVTLGALSFPKDEHGELVRDAKRHPTIEDNVVIYANATVLGGKTVVGHDSVVGSSVWLTQSIPPETTVLIQEPNNRVRNKNNVHGIYYGDYI